MRYQRACPLFPLLYMLAPRKTPLKHEARWRPPLNQEKSSHQDLTNAGSRWRPDLTFLVSKTEKIKLLFKSLVFCYRSPSRLTQIQKDIAYFLIHNTISWDLFRTPKQKLGSSCSLTQNSLAISLTFLKQHKISPLQ